MKVKLLGRLPRNIDRDLGFALTQLLTDIEKTLNALEDRGLDTRGAITIDNAATGVVLKDTQGTPHYWRLTVDNTGALVTTDEGTTKPYA